MPVERKSVYALIDSERNYQDTVHGTIEDCPHTLAGWLLILEAELNEAKAAWISGEKTILSEVIQIAGVAVACLEQLVVDGKEEIE